MAASMAEYQVILDGLSSFGVEVTAPDGFQSVRGFPTEAAALLWIAEQTAREANAGLRSRLNITSSPLPPVSLGPGGDQRLASSAVIFD
jgi:hypothetical protein